MKRTQTLAIGFLSLCFTVASLGYIIAKEDLLASLYKIVKVQDSGEFTQKYDATEHTNTGFSDRFYIESNTEGLNFIFPDQQDKNNINKKSVLEFTPDQVTSMMNGDIVLPTADQSLLLRQQAGEDYKFTIAQSTEPGKESEKMFYVNLNGTAYGIKSQNDESISAVLESNSTFTGTSVWDDIVASNGGNTNVGSTPGTNAGTNPGTTAGTYNSGTNPGINTGSVGGGNETNWWANPGGMNDWENLYGHCDKDVNRLYTDNCSSFTSNPIDCRDGRGPMVIEYTDVGMDYIPIDQSVYTRDDCRRCSTINQQNSEQYIFSGEMRNNSDPTGSEICEMEKCIDGVIYSMSVPCSEKASADVRDSYGNWSNTVSLEDYDKSPIKLEQILNGYGYTPGLEVTETDKYDRYASADSSEVQCGVNPYSCSAGYVGGGTHQNLLNPYRADESNLIWNCYPDGRTSVTFQDADAVECNYPRTEDDYKYENPDITREDAMECGEFGHGSGFRKECHVPNPSELVDGVLQNTSREKANGNCGSLPYQCTNGQRSGSSIDGNNHVWSCDGISGGTSGSCSVEIGSTVAPDSHNLDVQVKDASTAIKVPTGGGGASCGTNLGSCTDGSSGQIDEREHVYAWSCSTNVCYVTKNDFNVMKNNLEQSTSNNSSGIQSKNASDANSVPSGGGGGSCGTSAGSCTAGAPSIVEDRGMVYAWSCGGNVCFVGKSGIDASSLPMVDNTSSTANTSAGKSTTTNSLSVTLNPTPIPQEKGKCNGLPFCTIQGQENCCQIW